MIVTADPDVDGDRDVFFGTALIAPAPLRLLTNLDRQLFVPASAQIGGSLAVTAVARLGFATEKRHLVPVFGRRLPALHPLPRLGLLGLDPAGAVAVDPITTVPPWGIADLVCPVPNEPALRGLVVWLQGTWLDDSWNARLANLARTTVR